MDTNDNMGIAMSIDRRHCGQQHDSESKYDDENEYQHEDEHNYGDGEPTNHPCIQCIHQSRP